MYSLFLKGHFNHKIGPKMKTLVFLSTTLLLFVFNYNAFAFNKPDSTKSSAEVAVDPNTIIEKYVEAIGGKDAVAKVEDRTTIMRGTAMGQSITMILKQKAPNKLRQEMKAGGMEQVVIFDGEKGVMNVMNQKIEVKDKELDALKLEANMELMLDPAKYGIKLSFDGVEKFNDKDVYKIKMVFPSGLSGFSYFDLATGLKVKEDREVPTKMGVGQQTIVYDDYKDVDGVKYPFKITQSFGGQSVEVTVSSIKVNKGLTDDIFTITDDSK